MAMTILEYVKLYRPKTVDVWTIKLNAMHFDTHYNWVYTYDVPSDQLVKDSGPDEPRMTQAVREAITNRPHNGHIRDDGWNWFWYGVPAIGKRDPNDIEFVAGDVNRIEAFDLRVTMDGETFDAKVRSRAGRFTLSNPRYNQRMAEIVHSILHQLKYGLQKRGRVGDVTWELARIEWR